MQLRGELKGSVADSSEIVALGSQVSKLHDRMYGEPNLDLADGRNPRAATFVFCAY